uniref:Light-independent protochlorophyllide reductase subunit B n=1 Tax=Microrhizoidea pickettheapsiorum TaxID=2604950 RepID=A0A5B9RU87_9CHLO|nr:protochlorophyllide reductase subunit B [Microrhizoidea pickettheapsiorum]QEG77677.1 protochlorophyllide reductase subunit B [Microrhizoidea pickettheapsiorum]
MKLAYWQYAGPAHIGTLRVASSFKNIHAMMHGPLGDDYFNVMRSMLERERDFTPVTASIVDRHVLARGSQEKVVQNMRRKKDEEKTDLLILTPTCTSSILQEDLHHFVERLSDKTPALLADVNHYRINELQAADKTLEQIVRFALESSFGKNLELLDKEKLNKQKATQKPSVNIIGTFTLGFHNHHDCKELRSLFYDLGIEINEIIPEGATLSSLKNLPHAWFNLVPYRETGLMTAQYLKEKCDMPFVSIAPFGLLETKKCLEQIQNILNSEQYKSTELRRQERFDFSDYIQYQSKFVSQSAWFSRSIDCQNLTGKQAVVFGDATHAAGMTKLLVKEMGIHVICAGTYCKHDGDWFREQVQSYCDQILITDDHTQVNKRITDLQPAAIFGTQMERHIGKKLGIPCGVISAPVHIQNFSLGYRPFLGYEGTNNIADLVYNTFTLGMEDHLLEIFGGHDVTFRETNITSKESENTSNIDDLSRLEQSKANIEQSEYRDKFVWTNEALTELKKIPGFVRQRVKKNTEKFAEKNNYTSITLDLMFQAKEQLSSKSL